MKIQYDRRLLQALENALSLIMVNMWDDGDYVQSKQTFNRLEVKALKRLRDAVNISNIIYGAIAEKSKEPADES